MIIQSLIDSEYFLLNLWKLEICCGGLFSDNVFKYLLYDAHVLVLLVVMLFVDTFRRMEVNEEQSSQYPDRPGERDCQFFLRTGQCGYGNTCRYNHPLSHLPQVRDTFLLTLPCLQFLLLSSLQFVIFLFCKGVFYQRDDLPERIGQPDCEVHCLHVTIIFFFWSLSECIKFPACSISYST